MDLQFDHKIFLAFRHATEKSTQDATKLHSGDPFSEQCHSQFCGIDILDHIIANVKRVDCYLPIEPISATQR